MRPSDPRLRRRLAPARRPLLGVVGAGLVGSLLVLTQAWVVTGVVVAALAWPDGDRSLLGWSVAAAAVLGLRGLVGWGGDVLAARAAAAVATSMRRLLLVAACRDRSAATGETAVLVTRGVTAVEPYLTRYLPALVLAAILPPLTVVAIATQDLLSAVIVLLTLPLVPVFGALVGLATRDRAQRQWRAMASLSGHFLDVVRGLPTLVAHRRARAQSERIAEITDRYRRSSLDTLRIAFASSAVLELVATLSVALVAVTVGVRLAGGSLDLRTALVVLLLAPEAYWPLRKVGAEFHAAAEGVATFEAAHDLLERAGEEDAGTAAPAGADLELTGLAVTHPGRRQPAVHDVTAVVPARGVTVVTGPSGCGKSTLLAALAGLLDPSAGSLRAGGHDVGGRAWQEQVAWLPQQPVFVAGSIADNLRLAAPDADDDALWLALRQVALEVRVRALPGGLDAPLGEDGADLSAGERARLALARVVVARRPWMLLDEPTAHLDELTEQVIVDTIADLGRRGAVVVVAHRPGVLQVADTLLRMDAPAPLPAPADPVRTPARPAAAPPTTPVAAERRAPGLVGAALLGGAASASGVALTATAGWLIVQASTRPAILTLLVAIVGVRAFGLARPALRYVERLRSHDAALRLLARRRVEVYESIVPLTPARLGRRRGDVLASIVDDVDAVVDRELRVRLPLRSAAVVLALVLAVAALLLPVAALVVGLAAVLAGAGAFLVARLGASASERAAVELRAELSTAVVESIQVADELRLWQALGRAADRVAATSDRLGRVTVRAAVWSGGARALVLVVTGAAVAATALVAAAALAAGSVSGPVLALLVLTPLALAETLAPLADAGALSVRTEAAEGRLARLARTAPAVRDTVATAVAVSDDLAVEHVRARWTSDGPLTAPASLSVAPGERVAVVGSSGSGKSTLAALLLRFLDPAEGRITLGGASTRSLSLDDVRRHTGLVDDHPHVFATSLVENVRLARPDASDAEVEGALRRACLGPWLDALPAGLDTWLGDGHAAVSGGERARIGVARSLLAGQSLLVLDEPTAHLDHATATDLATEVLTDPGGRGVVWITHASPGLDLVDRVLDLDTPPV